MYGIHPPYIATTSYISEFAFFLKQWNFIKSCLELLFSPTDLT